MPIYTLEGIGPTGKQLRFERRASNPRDAATAATVDGFTQVSLVGVRDDAAEPAPEPVAVKPKKAKTQPAPEPEPIDTPTAILEELRTLNRYFARQRYEWQRTKGVMLFFAGVLMYIFAGVFRKNAGIAKEVASLLMLTGVVWVIWLMLESFFDRIRRR